MSRRILALIAIGVICTFLLIQNWVLREDHEDAWFVWVPVLLILGWSVWQLREKPDPESPAFDFNPKRGFLYFLLGFLIFPITLGLGALFGEDVSMTSVALTTLAGSIFVGLVGSFTEHVGV